MHITTRHPKKTDGFSWGRSVRHDGSVTWRLFRRDQRGIIHAHCLTFSHDEMVNEPAAAIAYKINRERHALRDRVDDVDLKLMGVTE